VWSGYEEQDIDVLLRDLGLTGRLGEITPGETHISWEAIGTDAETYGRMK